ncbi:MAG: aminotransferase class I/II-fold pyridoxal phosphate-dependent enzyme [Firmicutes bacterium]|nr:aminotransferase class I/II-fold pyridoxal phosphate-dependent enzyme [Bacillota bacterium]
MHRYLNIFNINLKVVDLVSKSERELKDIFSNIDQNVFLNSLKVISAFKEEGLSESDFASTTGYGYNDVGRDKIERIFAKVLGAEDALVRNQFISGTHALTVALFALLRPNDTLLSISGLPYDTLHEIIGIRENPSSLKSYNINYEQIDLVNDDFDYHKILETLKNKKIKLIEIQRSKGYSTRKSISIDKIEKVIKAIREVDQNVIIMIDNCYCEFVENISPLEVGADIIVGSLIKNLGGGIASNGAYIAGRKNLVELAAERLTAPGEGKEVGPSLGANREFLLGLYHAPSVVGSSLKTAVLTSKVLEELGYNVEPKYNDDRADIVQNIIFGNSEDLIKYCEGIQSASAIDAFALPEPTDMPGYDDKIIMASGSFTQGSSIEISCDGPIRDPFIAYQQGGLTYEYGKIALMAAVSKLIK